MSEENNSGMLVTEKLAVDGQKTASTVRRLFRELKPFTMITLRQENNLTPEVPVVINPQDQTNPTKPKSS